MKTTIFAVFLSASFAFAGKPITFQELAAGDTIYVTFRSSGCFGESAYEFTFEANSFTVKVTDFEHHWIESEKRVQDVTRISQGTGTLSAAEIAGLDRLFMFYRFKQPGGCTTVNVISATQKRGDTVLASESFTDESCATYDMPNLMLLPSIAAKAKPVTQ